MSCNLTFKGDSIPYLNETKVDEQVEKKKYGVYGLDRGSKDDPFKVYYIGRSDSCLNTRLKQHIGEEYNGEKYKWFKFDFASSIEEAFYKECRCYHHYGGKEKLDNEEHPKKT